MKNSLGAGKMQTGYRLFAQNHHHQHSVEIYNLFSCLRYFFINCFFLLSVSMYGEAAKRGLFTLFEGKNKLSLLQAFLQYQTREFFLFLIYDLDFK